MPVSTPALKNLARHLDGRLHLPGSPGYEHGIDLHFGDPVRRAAAVARVSSKGDVARAVEVAAELSLPVAVRSGGHSNARHGAADGALVLDMRSLNHVEIDAQQRIGRAGGGTLARDYTSRAGAHALATGFGDSPTVGIAGLTLGGGIGFLSRRDGLAIDNLRAAELVLADGTTTVASPGANSELFWAIRGGGGNFGVVTRLEYALHPTSTVTAGMLVFEPTPELMAAAVGALRDAPRELTVFYNLVKAPPIPILPESMHGRPALLAFPCWSGPTDQAKGAFAPLYALGLPVVEQISEQPYSALFDDAHGPGGDTVMHLASRPGFIDQFDEASAATAIDAVANAPTPLAAVNLRPMGGAIADIDRSATAFAHRDRAVMAFAAGLTPNAAQIPDGQAWADATAATLGLTGGYTNFMSQDTAADVASAYPDATLERLRHVKRTFDPANRFSANHNIRR